MFQLTKVWTDQEPGIEMVEIRYTWSPLGEPAKWEGEEEEEAMAAVPNTNPRVRQAVIEIPRYLNDQDAYHLHYRFVFVRDGRDSFPRFSLKRSSRGRSPMLITKGGSPRCDYSEVSTGGARKIGHRQN